MNAQAKSLVQIRDLYKRFSISGDFLDQLKFRGAKLVREQQHVHAINGVSLDVQRGEALCVVGESGCGKSTIARTVMGLLSPSAGTISYGGERIDNLSDRQILPYRRKMQMIFQNPYAFLNPRMTIAQTLEEPVRFHNPRASATEVRDKVHEVMQSVGIDPSWGKRFPHEFSGGQRQRISITRETKARCHEIRVQEGNRLHFATTQTLYLCFYNDWIQPFSTEHGFEVELNLKSTAWVGADFGNALARGECDLVLCYWHPAIEFMGALDDDRFEHLTVTDEVLVPITALDDQRQPIYTLPGSRREPLPYIGYHEGAFARPVIRQFMQQQLLQPPQLVTMNENAHAISVKAMVKEGFGLGWVPRRLIDENLRYGQLGLAGDEHWQIPLQIRLYRRRHDHNANLEAFWSLLAERFERTSTVFP